IGASPRASIAMMKLSRVMALSQGSDFVIPEYVEKIAHYVLNHRIIIDQFVEGSDIKQDQITDSILKETPVPR
ncbi:MAG: AAA family ATPase, partial [Candidatus Delongbacteria bacterium]|nr:AAA family ATPase [Candidatus Delongbacteria bacterium]